MENHFCRLPWQNGQTYGEIIETYVDYITKIFGEKAIVVFDGYSSTPSAKDVQFTKTSKMNMKKQQILENTTNKQNFINMLSSNLTLFVQAPPFSFFSL